jgi:hypothetical protein
VEEGGGGGEKEGGGWEEMGLGHATHLCLWEEILAVLDFGGHLFLFVD